jgi:predicted nucleic acid-binding protein
VIADASVIVAAFSQVEAAHAVAREWLERALRAGLSAPVILLPEVASAIARSSGDAALAGQIVSDLLVSPINFLEVDGQLAAESARIARVHGIKGCDSIYVALAVRLNQPLVTLDAEQLTLGGMIADVRWPEPPDEQGAPDGASVPED